MHQERLDVAFSCRFYKNDTSLPWIENLKEIATVSYIEDFWATQNQLYDASALSIGSDYHLFKEGIKPMWEDEANRGGGRWLYNSVRSVRAEAVGGKRDGILLIFCSREARETPRSTSTGGRLCSSSSATAPL